MAEASEAYSCYTKELSKLGVFEVGESVLLKVGL
jgi:hypothetical protein